MLKINDLTVKYGDYVAVDGLTLHIQPGEIYGFIGHNGAGKTTTIKSCCGILPFASGEIILDGHSVKNEPIEAKKSLAYIPDNPDLYEYMTGLQYINFIADVYGVAREGRAEKIEKYGNMFEILDNLASPISSYSHGMKQKVAVMSALIHEPKLMIMDEPFVGLDPKATHQFKEIMKEMCNSGASILFSTHILDVAEKICDKVAIIRKGKLVVTGTMDEVRGDTSLENVFLELTEND